MKERKIEGIADLRDESDRDGIRIVIDLKRDEVSGVILNQLFKHTQMENTFGISMLAIDAGQPRVMNLKETLQRFVAFRKIVITRRTIFELNKASERAHILDGLITALDNIDAVVALIKASENPQTAADGLMKTFGLTEVQAKAILEMRLQRLTGLEREKILSEHAELTRLIAELKGILDDPQKVLEIIVEELEDSKKKFGDERRTEIVESTEDINIEDMIVEEDMVVTVSHQGYIKRNPVSLYRIQRRGGKGKMGMTTKEEDFVEHIFIASTHNYILIFTNQGRVYWLKVYQLPQAGRAAKGKAIVNLVNMNPGEKVAAVLPVRAFEDDKFVVMATKKGIIKKTELAAYSNPRTGGIIAISVEAGRRAHGCQTDQRRPGDLPRDPQGHGHPLQGRGCPRHGPHRHGGHRHPHGRRRPRRGDGDPHGGQLHHDRLRARLRQAHRDRRVPPPEPRRQGHPQPQDDAAHRARLRHPAGHGR